MIGRILRGALAIVLIVAIAISVYQILNIMGEYGRAEEIQREMLTYKPTPPAADRPAQDPEASHRPAETVNQSVIDAQNNVNGDIVGWLTIPNTNVDYLFVQAPDDDFYLHRDLNKKNAAAGSIFMDSRCDKEFSQFNTILYGHHMKNGSMFQSLKKFSESDFFNDNLTGFIYLARKTYALRIFAFLVVRSDDEIIYGTLTASPREREEFYSYVREKAQRYRDVGFADDDRIVTLSTCSYEYDEARMVVLARLEEVPPA